MEPNARKLPFVPNWLTQPVQWAELFVLSNLAFLAIDIYLAHSVNRFARPAEWTPFVFSIVGTVIMLACIAIVRLDPIRRDSGGSRFAWYAGVLVGVGSILVGVIGLLLHLESGFFESQTVKNLVYTAPFAAPLSYTGLGLLILLNRMVDSKSDEWAAWILFLALGGFIGNFVLSLADHAQNAFWNRAEWIPVYAAAIGMGFLVLPLLLKTTRGYLQICFVVMALEMAVGLAGSVYHVIANLRGPAKNWSENFIYGAPIFAPLLFANLALLACIGLWPLWKSEQAGAGPQPSLAPAAP